MWGIFGVLHNESGSNIMLAEVLPYSPPGSPRSVVMLPPRSRRSHPASKFSDRNQLGGQTSTIEVSVDGVMVSHLMPDHFKRFIKLIFNVDGEGNLTIKGVEAKFADHLQIWGWRCFGRRLEGQPELAIG